MLLTRHFNSGPLMIRDGENEHSLEISQWVPIGAALCSLDREAGSETFRLQCGEGTELSDDAGSIVTTKAGYPYLEINKTSKETVVTGSVEPMLEISEAGWFVKLTLYPALPGSVVPDPQMILTLLHDEGVRYGIREKSVIKAYEKVTGESGMVHNLVIAKGRLPVNGQDGKLRFSLEIGVQPGKERLDGSMDFRERNMFIGVEKGQLLATRVAPTAGMKGLNIFGEEISQKTGKDFTIKPNPGIDYNEATGEIRAACNGVVAMVKEAEVSVTNLQVIQHNVDYGTGNIRSQGGVEIKGNVLPGFSVTATGDISVEGGVTGGKLTGGANVTIKGGVSGSKSEIEARGDVELSFIEEGKVTCGGTLRAEKAIYFSEVRCERGIIAAPDTKVVASTLITGGQLQLGHVDTESSPNSMVAAATSPARYERLLALREKVSRDQKKLARLETLVGTTALSPEKDELMAELAEEKNLLKNFNLCPDGEENCPFAGLRYACRHTIEVSGSISQGVIVRIGNSSAQLRAPISQPGTIMINPDSEKLMFHPTDPKKFPYSL